MKKLLCMILALSFLLTMGSALADMSLYDMWHDYTYDTPGYGGKRSVNKTDSGRRVEGYRVGEITDWMMDCEISPNGGDLRDMIVAWNRGTEGVDQPFFDALEYYINNVDVEIFASEFYTFKQGGSYAGEAELYMLDIGVNLPAGREEYTVLVCLQLGVETLEAAEYYVLSGDLGALGVTMPFATWNYLGDMYVDFCDEWVSLRETPSTKAERITKVYKYENVYDCFIADNGFVRCVYQGMEGYILWDYLSSSYY